MLMLRMVMRAAVSVCSVVVLTVFHHPHHLRAAGPEKYGRQDEEDGTKDDVEHGGVVEGYRRVDDCCMPLRRDPSERLEQRFDHECR